MCTHKMRALSYIGAEKITFSPKPDRQTYRQTDFSFYRVASLLKRCKFIREKASYLEIIFFPAETLSGVSVKRKLTKRIASSCTYLFT